jgi:hypothetical protein
VSPATTCAIKLIIVFITGNSTFRGTTSKNPPSPTRTLTRPPHPKRKRSLITEANFFQSPGECQVFQDQDRASEWRASPYIGWHEAIMFDNPSTACKRDPQLENTAAELTSAIYPLVLRQGLRGLRTAARSASSVAICASLACRTEPSLALARLGPVAANSYR